MVPEPRSLRSAAPNAVIPPARDPTPRPLLLLESACLFLAGVLLMTFFLHMSVQRPGDEIGVPEHDAYYHIKMALMLPEWGLVRDFPWLQFAYFRQQGHDFVSHHCGFHFLLVPFVHAAQWLTGDPLAGGRWAVAAFFGLNLMLANLLLRAGNVPLRWLWLILFLALPSHFFLRQSYVRAIGPSLAFLLLIVLLLYRDRYIWAAIATGLYVHLYLGAVLFAPVVVALYAIACVLGPAGERHWPWKMVLLSLAGWALGVLTYPYSAGMWEFLRLQVFGSGLTPDIEVGSEWQPYSGPWWFVGFAAPVLAVWLTALVLRVRLGPLLTARDLGLLLMHFAFLLLTFKARRFIEYWPVFCWLSAAYLAAPLLRTLQNRLHQPPRTPQDRLATAWLPLLLLAVAAVALVCWGLLFTTQPAPQADPAAATSRLSPHLALFLGEWRFLLWISLLLALPALTRPWLGKSRAAGTVPLFRLAAVPLAGVMLVGLLALLLQIAIAGSSLPPPRLPVPGWAWAALAASYVGGPVLLYVASRARDSFAPAAALPQTAATLVGALLLLGGTGALLGPRLVWLGQQTGCFYNLTAVRDLMDFMKANTRPGEVVFTDDWDVFPVFFYHNSHNYYIVGLDPKFTHERRPDLWERYVRITRGEIPTTSRIALASTGPAREKSTSTIHISLADIPEHFGARYVITDTDHRSFSSKLARNPQFELIYPCRTFERCSAAPYLVFRVRQPGEPQYVRPPTSPDAAGHLHLTLLDPVHVEQGYGQLMYNLSVERQRLQLGGREYYRGLGTHAPSEIVYDLPAGFDRFEAVVGIDQYTGGEGSAVVSVLLDDREVFTSPVLTGLSQPLTISLPIGDARRLTLRALPTGDGNRFDHLDWADARLVRAGEPATNTLPATRAADAPPP